ncbi:MAG: autotransporter domain-containing protein [Verrucomicrobia bacterium]|nr:autotransporter domain-containing protein [Verrucomicrobiota bacterium]
MTSSASISTTLLKVGTSSADRAVLDVSGLSGGALVLSSSQTLSGGGKVVGSVVSNGSFSPGNSPGTFTVGKAAANTGGDLTLNGPVLIEYGKNAATGNIDTDVVVVSGTLTFGGGSSIILSKYSDGVTYGSFATTSLALGNIFQAGSISGAPTVSLASGGLLTSVTSSIVGNSLQLSVVKASYGSVATSANSRSLGNYLNVVSAGTVGSSLSYLLSVLDASASASELEANLKALTAPVYAESQRLSLRRTAAISETLQSHLTAFPEGDRDGWTAWSESYVWGLHRDATSSADSWNGNTTGEVVGVQNTRKGLTFGAFGATGHTSASFTSASLKGDSFHGGLYAHIEAGMPFLDVSWLAGSVDQTATRSISVGSYNSSARSSFQSSEYAVHLRGGLTIPNVAGAYKVVPSIAILRNGYSQDGTSESGADGAALTTDRVRGDAWQARVGSEVSRPFKAGKSPANLLASAYWIHDFNRSARTVNTRLSGVSSAAGSFTTSGEPVGGDGLELGLGATVALTKRTSARLSGNWQIRDGLNQPNLNLGLTVQF